MSQRSGNGEREYIRLINEMVAANKCSLEIDYKQFIFTHPNIAIWLADAPQSVLEVMEEVALNVVLNLHPNLSFFNYPFQDSHVLATQFTCIWVIKDDRAFTNTKWQSIKILDPIIQAERQNEPQIKADSFKGINFPILEKDRQSKYP